MEILTTDQKVLNLILSYHDNPVEANLQDTLKKIREYYPVTVASMALDWEFKLTNESLIYVSSKYLKQDLQLNSEWYILEVESFSLSMRILSMEDYMENLPRKMSRVWLGL